LLAQLIVETGGDLARARALAMQARDGWRAHGDPEKIEEVEALVREIPALPRRRDRLP
jgi:hypothetical protein